MTNDSQLRVTLLDVNSDSDVLNIKYHSKKLLKDNSWISKVNFVFDLQNKSTERTVSEDEFERADQLYKN